ncbi:MAG: hypothetical protein SCM11_19750 [Bacillota bacterium]|nr:hypothetical protein [Bacillota bacterium]
MSEMIELKTELDKLIGRLNGVLAARTVLNDQDEIVEIHILSDLTKSPKQLVRDVQSAIMAAYGLDIDYKLISVAQVNSNMVMPSPVVHYEPRLLIRRITISLDSQNVETTVTLGKGDQQYEGSCRSPLSGRNRIQSAINACLAALKEYLGPSYTVSMLELQRQTIAGSECFIIGLSYSEPLSESVLYGIAPINSPDTEVQSAVMAVLSALNRPMGRPRKAT